MKAEKSRDLLSAKRETQEIQWCVSSPSLKHRGAGKWCGSQSKCRRRPTAQLKCSGVGKTPFPMCSSIQASRLDEGQPHQGGQPSLLRWLIQRVPSPRNTLTFTPSILFNQISGHCGPVKWHRKLTLTPCVSSAMLSQDCLELPTGEPLPPPTIMTTSFLSHQPTFFTVFCSLTLKMDYLLRWKRKRRHHVSYCLNRYWPERCCSEPLFHCGDSPRRTASHPSHWSPLDDR